MFLEPKTNVIPEDTLSSIYDKECAGIVVNEEFQNMQVTGVKGSLCDVLAHQFKIHLNISATCEKIVDEIASVAMKDLSDKDVHSQSEISELQTASNLFLADIVVFKDANQHTVIKAKKSVDERTFVCFATQ